MTQHLDVERLAVPDGAVWIYLSYQHYGLKATDGEIIAEVTGNGLDGCYFFKNKKYHGLEEAKAAAIRALAEGVRHG